MPSRRATRRGRRRRASSSDNEVPVTQKATAASPVVSPSRSSPASMPQAASDPLQDPSSSGSEDFAGDIIPRRQALLSSNSSASSERLSLSSNDTNAAERSLSESSYSYQSDEDREESTTFDAAEDLTVTVLRNREEVVHPITFDTKAEARVTLDGLENARFSVTGNNRYSARLSCTSHVGCTAEARIKRERNGRFRLFRSGIHTTEIAAAGNQRDGIHKSLLAEIDNLRLGGQGPRQCLTTLQDRYRNNETTLNLLPSVTQLKNRAHKLRKSGDFEITTHAEIMEWAAPRMCLTKSSFLKHFRHGYDDDALRISHQPLEYQNELIVLQCFTDELEDGRLSVGIIFTSRRLFCTIPRMMVGQRGEVLLATDGTYKLHFGGWTLVSLGTYGVRYTTTHKYQQEFYPAAFMFVRAETTVSYARLFKVVKDCTQEFFGGTLDVQFGSMDHATEIANAFREVWPDITLLNCWPHLDRNARNKKSLLTKSERYNDIIKPQLDYLSNSRSFDQFEALAHAVTSNWSTLGEAAYADWLEEQYLTDPWDLWFYAASDKPGIVPNQNPIESHHRRIKTTAASHLRASTGHVLAGTLPRILTVCAMDIGTDRICHYASGPVPAEMLQEAVMLCLDENHYLKPRGRSRAAVSRADEYFFNAGYYVVRDDNVHGVNVNATRTRLYKRSLDGILRAREEIENVQLRYLSLHRVVVLERLPFEHDWDSPSWSVHEIRMIRSKFKCDCKVFFQSGWLCAHILACLHLVDSVDLHTMLRGLPARKPPGRPKKKTKCLERDGLRRSQFSVDALIKKLVDKPASVINWSILSAWTSTDEEGEEIHRDYVGENQASIHARWQTVLGRGVPRFGYCENPRS